MKRGSLGKVNTWFMENNSLTKKTQRQSHHLKPRQGRDTFVEVAIICHILAGSTGVMCNSG